MFDGPTDGRTDERTDTPFCRDERTLLNKVDRQKRDLEFCLLMLSRGRSRFQVLDLFAWFIFFIIQTFRRFSCIHCTMGQNWKNTEPVAYAKQCELRCSSISSLLLFLLYFCPFTSFPLLLPFYSCSSTSALLLLPFYFSPSISSLLLLLPFFFLLSSSSLLHLPFYSFPFTSSRLLLPFYFYPSENVKQMPI